MLCPRPRDPPALSPQGPGGGLALRHLGSPRGGAGVPEVCKGKPGRAGGGGGWLGHPYIAVWARGRSPSGCSAPPRGAPRPAPGSPGCSLILGGGTCPPAPGARTPAAARWPSRVPGRDGRCRRHGAGPTAGFHLRVQAPGAEVQVSAGRSPPRPLSPERAWLSSPRVLRPLSLRVCLS